MRRAAFLLLLTTLSLACTPESSPSNAGGSGGSAGAAPRCGKGTVLVAGECIPESPVQCGEGTELKGSTCVPAGQGGAAGAGAGGTAGNGGAGQAGAAGYTGKNSWGGFPGAGGGIGDGGMGGGNVGGDMGFGGFAGGPSNCDSGTCPHDVCADGEKLAKDCSSCAAAVCAADEYCCMQAWDGQCIQEAQQFCACNCGVNQGGMGGAAGQGGGGAMEPACDLPAEPPSKGACAPIGGDIKCNPVTTEGCDGPGSSCDYSDKGYECYPPPNDKKLCEPCNPQNNEYCQNGSTCINNICLRYCCEDADCGENGVCSKEGGAAGVCYRKATATCAGGIPIPPGPCEACISASCCAQSQACNNDAACTAAIACTTACGNDSACQQKCFADIGGNFLRLQQLGECAAQNGCEAACAQGAGGSAGAAGSSGASGQPGEAGAAGDAGAGGEAGAAGDAGAGGAAGGAR